MLFMVGSRMRISSLAGCGRPPQPVVDRLAKPFVGIGEKAILGAPLASACLHVVEKIGGRFARDRRAG